MSTTAQALHRTSCSAKKIALHKPVLGSSQTKVRVVARPNPEPAAKSNALAPNPLWVITIGMAVFFGSTVLLMIVG